MWWKKNRWKVLVPILAVAVLAAAFWYGGDAPGMRGWTPDSDATLSDVAGEEAASSATVEEPQEEAPPAASAEPDIMEPTDTDPEPESPEGEPPPVSTPAEGAEQGQQDEPPQQEPDIDPDTGKDKYLTDPVPEGRPAPVEPEDVTISDVAHTCTISISCAAILDNLDWLDPDKTELVPEDGWILEPVTVTFYEGESVFNVLQRTCKQQKIHMEFENTPIYNSAYIEGIHNLYEFDCGELSGWMYSVNDWFPNYGCSRYQLLEGDVIRWVYTCDLGADVGGGYAAD